MITDEQLKVIFERTRCALKDQGEVPMSPGRIIDSGDMLCYGATLVHEALLVVNTPTKAADFARRVVTEPGSFIEDVGESIGLDRKMIAKTKRFNDNLENKNRFHGVLNHVQSMQMGIQRQ